MTQYTRDYKVLRSKHVILNRYVSRQATVNFARRKGCQREPMRKISAGDFFLLQCQGYYSATASQAHFYALM